MIHIYTRNSNIFTKANTCFSEIVTPLKFRNVHCLKHTNLGGAVPNIEDLSRKHSVEVDSFLWTSKKYASRQHIDSWLLDYILAVKSLAAKEKDGPTLHMKILKRVHVKTMDPGDLFLTQTEN